MKESYSKRWLWPWIGCFLIGWIFACETSDLWAARTNQIEKDITQKKRDLKDIKKEISVTKEKEKEIRGKESSILGTLHLLEGELYKKEKELKQMEAQLVKTQEKLQQTKSQILLLNRRIERTKEELFSRLIALYKMGRMPKEGFLLASQSYHDLLMLDKYCRVLIDYDTHLIKIHRYQVALKERYQEELIQDQSQMQRNISQIGKKKREVTKGSGEKRELLKSIRNQKTVYQKLVTELEERGKKLQTLIGRLEQEKSLQGREKLKPEVPKGKLTPPVQGKVISLFKEKGQNGIEIKAPMGAEIRAVLSGKVLYADWFKGFGNVVIIDHGDHTFTIYGYASELLKKEGDIVSQGETIALVGSSGSLKGPCLYFEIRHQGKPQDPMHWISPLDKVVFRSESNDKGKK